MTTMKKNKQLTSLAGVAASVLGMAVLGLTGCGVGGSGNATGGTGTIVSLGKGTISGNVHGGQQPVTGAKIQLYAVGSTGLASAATALIPSADQVVYNSSAPAGTTGALTDSNGNFVITGDYTCPTPSPQVYLVATGGSSGGTANSAIALMALVGDCATLATNAATSYVQINELTTVASAYALAPFMTSYANVGASTVNSTGLINGVANFNNLVNLSSGAAGGASLPAGAVVPTTEINTLGNILAACVNTGSNTSTNCATLLTATGASETVGAALAFAKNPGSSTLTALNSLSSSTAPFQPSYSAAPNDWTIAVKYNAGGNLSAPYGIAIDSVGRAWVANSTAANLAEFSAAGALINLYTATGLLGPKGIAIDRTGNVWVTNEASNSIYEFNSAGVVQSGAAGFTGGGLNGPISIAMDSAGNAWIANLVGNSVTELSSTGSVMQNGLTASGTISGPTGVALDASGNVYIANGGNGNVVKLTNAGAVASSSPYTDIALQGTTGVAVDTSGNVWATGSTTGSALAGSVSQFGNTGTPASYSPLSNGGLALPLGVAVSGSTAWVTNGGTSGTLSQLKLAQTSPLSPAAGFGSSEVAVGGLAGLSSPVGIAVDPSGDVWTADSGDNTVSVFIGLTSPVVTPLAANVGP